MSQHANELKKIFEAGAGFRPAGAFIAGGALTCAFTGKDINDVDMYFKSKKAFIDAVQDAYDDNLWCVAATDRAVTFVKGAAIVQLMHFDFFESAEQVFDAFDFTMCMGAYDLDAEQFIFHDDFLKHASQRFLRFHSGTRYPFGSLMRVLKYQSRGYTIGKGDLLRIALCCHRVPLTSWDELACAIGGQYGEKVSFESDKPFSIEAALDVIATSEFMVSTSNEAMPGSANELLDKVGVVKLRAEARAEREEFAL